jgi:endonuclease G, mitochondrial
MTRVTPDDRYAAARPAGGYDPAFLGPTLALPSPNATVRALDYPRFTVLLDPARRFARVTAVNIDGESLRDLPRTGDWHFDDRVAPTEQAGNDVYSRNDLDRGHLVRRRDPGWGETSDARAATEATFCYTNAAPQAADFNQSKDLWLGLEDHVLAYAQAERTRLSVFTAPVLEPADPPYRGIQVPLRFWKVAAWSTGGSRPQLAAAGFVLDQTELVDTRQGVLGVRPLGAFRTFQAPIGDIGAAAGLDLGVLVEADVLPREGVRPTPWRELADSSGITLG